VYNHYERVAKEIILPYVLSHKQNHPLYRNGWERRRIQQFLGEYKELAIQSVAADIDRQVLELRKKLERARSEKKKGTLQEQIQRLQEERKAYEMANLIL
jgi:dihydropteroate synthase